MQPQGIPSVSSNEAREYDEAGGPASLHAAHQPGCLSRVCVCVCALVLQRQHSDDDSDVLLRRGTVLYDFAPEEEDEVAVIRGEAVEIEYEVGGWIQVSELGAFYS